MTKGGKYIFANPAACGGITPSRRTLLENVCKQTSFALKGLSTRSAEEFDRLIDETVNESDVVVFAGGDGTFHQGLNRVYRKNVTIGYIPFGTGNAAAYALSILKPGPLSALSKIKEEAIVGILMGKNEQPMDLVEVTSSVLPTPKTGLFSSAGWCALMASKRKGKGLSGYLIPTVKNLFTDYYEQDVKVYCDDELIWNGINTLVIATKSPYYGAGLTVAPEVHLSDENIDLVIYTRSPAEMAGFMASSFLGKQPVPDYSQKAKAVRIESKAGRLPVQIDGEYYGEAQEVVYKVLPKAIRVLCGFL